MAITNIQVKAEFDKYEQKLAKALDHFKTDLLTVRAGRANPQILNKIYVDYYGVSTQLSQMANISVPDPRSLVISLWDAGMLKEVKKAIVSSDIGINPTDDGKVIRLIFPQLTEERRKDLTKQIKKTAEDCKIILRNERRDVVEAIKKLKKDNFVTEDEVTLYEKEVQKVLDKNMETIDKIYKEKEAEILEV